MASRWLALERGSKLAANRVLIRGMASQASQQDDSQPQSWFQKIKSVFIRKSDPETPKIPQIQQAAAPKPTKPEEAKSEAQVASSPLQTMASKVVNTVKDALAPGVFNMEAFANEMKNARRVESLTKLVKGMPKNREHLVAGLLERQEKMLRAMAAYKTEQISAQQKAEVAQKCGGTILEVDELLAKYYWAKEAHAKVEKLKKDGKTLPKNMQEVEAMMGGSYKSPIRPKQGRNDFCLCGSGKRYKRCCGKVYEAKP